MFFTPHECGSPGADTHCFSVGPGYAPVPEHWNTILRLVPKSLLCTRTPSQRKEECLCFPSNLGNSLFSSHCKHAATVRTTQVDCMGRTLLPLKSDLSTHFLLPSHTHTHTMLWEQKGNKSYGVLFGLFFIVYLHLIMLPPFEAEDIGRSR